MGMLQSRIENLIKRFETEFEPLNQVELSRSAALNNFDVMKSLSPGGVIPVLKTNAYGHGLREIASILKDRPIDLMAVDGYFEALELRQATNTTVLIMGAILPANYKQLELRGFSYVVQSAEAIRALGARRQWAAIHLEVDSGMHRQGIQPKQLGSMLSLIKRYPKLKLEGVMSHLANGDSLDNSFNLRQTEIFDAVVAKTLAAGFKPKFLHLAQSTGAPKIKSKYANYIRPGIAIYGINALSANDIYYQKLADLKPVMQIASRIAKIQAVASGEPVSYGGTFITKRPSRIGVLPIGYGEGIPRSLANRGVVKAGKHYLPIVGKICMNHMMVDVTDTNLREWDEVIVLSCSSKDKNSIELLCRDFDFFNYRFLTAISPSIRRVIVN